MCVCIPEYVPGVHEGQTRVFNLLELKLWIDVSYHVGPGKWYTISTWSSVRVVSSLDH